MPTAYARYNIRVKRLIDARKVDTSVKIFGETWASPIFICPVSSLGALPTGGRGRRGARRR
jgi:isopentenyl diphosphate isomerase/L-lactate dehydrogenase-like FMN-dependent dehydrogenase